MVQTDRLNVHVLSCGPENGTPVLFVHGNVSSATYWEETMLALPDGFRAIAVDLRGYGDTEPLPISGITGMADFAADVRFYPQKVNTHACGRFALHYSGRSGFALRLRWLKGCRRRYDLRRWRTQRHQS